MYADIAAHRAMRSLFLRLTVNDVMSPPVVEYRNRVRIRSICVVITNYDNITHLKPQPKYCCARKHSANSIRLHSIGVPAVCVLT